jgi:SAM-dependent methyltransferase
MDWENIWSKEKEIVGNISLEKLLWVDGFDSGAGKVSVVDWVRFLENTSNKLDIKPHDSIFEVGCGGGAFLYYFYNLGHKVAGIDFSTSLIQIARRAMPEMNFEVQSAIDLSTVEDYDFVISFGVFHYFPNLEYSQMTIEKMINKANKAVAIYDLPDFEKKEASEKERKRLLPEGEYEKKYSGLSHLYYHKDWFLDLEKKFPVKIQICDQQIMGYGNSDFRFNVLITKE